MSNDERNQHRRGNVDPSELDRPNDGKDLGSGRRMPFTDRELASLHAAEAWQELCEGMGDEGHEGILIVHNLRNQDASKHFAAMMDWLADAHG